MDAHETDESIERQIENSYIVATLCFACAII